MKAKLISTLWSKTVTLTLAVVMALTAVLSAAPTQSVAASPLGAPPSNMFQWPWALNQTGQMTQGPHSDNWSGLDINSGSISWNSSTRQEVRAAAAGTARVISSCYIIIDHANGWSTGYVHIRAEISSGPVAANQKIGIIETNQAAAQCGGKADGPHLHFRLFYNGAMTSIVGATFGGWTVGVENGYYQDPANKRSLYTKNGVTKYIYQSLDNGQGVIQPPVIVFAGGSSSLWQDQNWGRANLKVCASNLPGNTVYVRFFRAGREWNYSQFATSTCVTFWDLDGAGPLNGRTTYYSQAALNQKPNASWPIPCAGPSGGQGLCDKIYRP